jgi:hypothetical protein
MRSFSSIRCLHNDQPIPESPVDLSGGGFLIHPGSEETGGCASGVEPEIFRGTSRVGARNVFAI